MKCAPLTLLPPLLFIHPSIHPKQHGGRRTGISRTARRGTGGPGAGTTITAITAAGDEGTGGVASRPHPSCALLIVSSITTTDGCWCRSIPAGLQQVRQGDSSMPYHLSCSTEPRTRPSSHHAWTDSLGRWATAGMWRNPPQTAYLDGLRGLACLTVMVWHFLCGFYPGIAFADPAAVAPEVRYLLYFLCSLFF